MIKPSHYFAGIIAAALSQTMPVAQASPEASDFTFTYRPVELSDEERRSDLEKRLAEEVKKFCEAETRDIRSPGARRYCQRAIVNNVRSALDVRAKRRGGSRRPV